MDLLRLIQGIACVRNRESSESSICFLHRAPGESSRLAYSEGQLIAFADSLDYDFPLAVIRNISKQATAKCTAGRAAGISTGGWLNNLIINLAEK